MREIKIGGAPWQGGPPSSDKKFQGRKRVELGESEWSQSERHNASKRRIELNHESEWDERPQKKITKNVENIKQGEWQGWDNLSGLQDPEVTRQFDGINELNPFAIKDEHATRTKNMSTKNYPALSVRDGSTSITSTITAEIDGIGIRGQEVHVIAGGVWYMYSGAAWTTLKTGLNTKNKWTFVNFQGGFTANNLLATNGVDAALRYDGTSVKTLANAPAMADFVCTHDNRVYLASKSTVYYSALRKAEDWNTVNESGQIVVETADGKSITGLVAGSAHLTVFKPNSIHELYGTSPSNFTMQIVTDNLGSPTGNSAQVIDGVIYFLGNDAIYRYSGGALPNSDFSIQVRGTIGKINKAYAYKSVSWTIGKKYYLAIPTGTSQSPNTILEYDVEFNAWNIWSLPANITARGTTLDGVAYIGGANGKLYKFDGTSATDAGTAIAWEWVSKPFSFLSLATKTRWYKMWVIADVPVGSAMRVYVSGEEKGENWTLVHTVSASENAQAKEIIIPTNSLSNTNWARIRLEGTGPAVVYEVSRQTRVFPFGQS